MSKLIAVRIPDDLAALVEAKGKTSEVVTAALRAHLDSSRFEPDVDYSCLPCAADYARPSHDQTCRCYVCEPPK